MRQRFGLLRENGSTMSDDTVGLKLFVLCAASLLLIFILFLVTH
jgi:hypothetical protein